MKAFRKQSGDVHEGCESFHSIVGGDRSPLEPSESSLFSPIPTGWFSPSWFVVSTGFHLILLLLLIAVPFWKLRELPQPEPQVVFVNLQSAEPLIEPPEAPPGPEMQAAPASRQPKNAMYWSAAKKPEMVQELVVPENPGKKDLAAPAEIEPPARPTSPSPPVLNIPPEPLKPEPAVITGVFASDSAAAPVNRPVREVQTGAFNSPQGIARAAVNSVVPTPSMGTFDASAGPGNGNEGNRGVQGKVASAGFESGIAGNGDAKSSGNTSSGNGHVKNGAFADLHKPAARVWNADPPPPTPLAMTPVEILFKPKPIYTREARDLKVQGEVLVEVLFKATGEVQVLQLVHGLGHGLDDSALRAAAMIRFKPAQRDGKPVDYHAVVHIIFDLI
jgi:TonB family protein